MTAPSPRLGEISARLAEVGHLHEWRVDGGQIWARDYRGCVGISWTRIGEVRSEDVRTFVIHASDDVAWLLAELAAKDAEVERLEGQVHRLMLARSADAERRYELCDADPRIFVRTLRAFDWSEGEIDPRDPLYDLSEGRATELMAEREARAVTKAVSVAVARLTAEAAAVRAAAIEDVEEVIDGLWSGGSTPYARGRREMKIAAIAAIRALGAGGRHE